MTQHTVKQAAEPMVPETKPPGGAMAMCPDGEDVRGDNTETAFHRVHPGPSCGERTHQIVRRNSSCDRPFRQRVSGLSQSLGPKAS